MAEADRNCYNYDCLTKIMDTQQEEQRPLQAEQAGVQQRQGRCFSAKNVALASGVAILGLAAFTAVIITSANTSTIAESNAKIQQLQAVRHVTYVRWGHLDCPHIPGTTMVYYGFASSTHQSNITGSQCLPEDYRHIHYYNNTASEYGTTAVYRLHGMEYSTFVPGRTNNDVPCALCKAASRSTVLMIPATDRCNNTNPSENSWTKEYNGYLMLASGGSQYYCVDAEMEVLYKDQHNADLSVFSHAVTGPDPPHANRYDPTRVLTCVVCTI